MRYEISLIYNEDLIRDAVRRFWWRVIGPGFVLAAALLAVFLTVLVLNGDTSWIVGAIGTVLAIGLVFAAGVYVVHYRNSLAKFRAMGDPSATLVVTDETLSFSSGAGSATLPWSSVQEVWQFPKCWLLLFSKAQFVTLPLNGVAPDALEFILRQVHSSPHCRP